VGIEDNKMIKSGMSGSPIVDADGAAVGVVSTGKLNPRLSVDRFVRTRIVRLACCLTTNSQEASLLLSGVVAFSSAKLQIDSGRSAVNSLVSGGASGRTTSENGKSARKDFA
jgi:hypothetical protein